MCDIFCMSTDTRLLKWKQKQMNDSIVLNIEYSSTLFWLLFVIRLPVWVWRLSVSDYSNKKNLVAFMKYFNYEKKNMAASMKSQ